MPQQLNKTDAIAPEAQAQQEELAQLVLFELDDEEYALPIIDTQEVVKVPEITTVPSSPTFVAGIINLRGKVITVIDLEKRFGLNRENKAKPEHIIVTDVGEVPFGILVDTVTEVLRVTTSSIQKAPKTVSSKIGSAYITGVVVIKNQEEEKAEKQEQEAEKQTEPASESERVVLLLDLRKVMDKKAAKKMKKAVPDKSPEPTPTKEAPEEKPMEHI